MECFGAQTGTREAEVLDGFCFSASMRRFSSTFDTLTIVLMASVNRANSGLFGGVFMALS
jgi:hypothetical protein